MEGASLYLACIGNDGELVSGTSCCSMCRRMVINAGIKDVYVRDTKTEYRRIDVFHEWVETDDSLQMKSGY